MNAQKVGVLHAIAQADTALGVAGMRQGNIFRVELRDAGAVMARLIAALEVAQGDLHMLKKAIEARDPWSELLIRATDTDRDLRAALAAVRGAS